MDKRNYGSTGDTSGVASASMPETVRLLPEAVTANLNRRASAPKNSLLFLFVMFYVLYLVTGGLIFSALETPFESRLQQDILQTRSKFLTEHPCVDEAALELLIQKVLTASDNGVSAAKNATSDSNWTFAKSVFFSSTIITTIGYGQVSPSTESGKVFCMIYGCFGIPMTLVLFSALVERLLTPACWFLRYLMRCFGHRWRPFLIRLLHLSLYVVFVLVFFYIIPAAVFNYLEPDWDYLDSIYYCFISLTTIGLGDYVPGDATAAPYRAIYKIATTCYLLVGLTFMMLFLTMFADIPQLNLGLLFSNFDSERYSKLQLTVDELHQVNQQTDAEREGNATDRNGALVN